MPLLSCCPFGALQTTRGFNNCSSKSAQGENDLRLCITNYFKKTKMPKPKGTYKERNTFTPDMKIAMAQQLVNMHRNGEIAPHTIGSHVVPRITTMLTEIFGVAFPRDTIQQKYYALQNLTRLYMSFKRRGTGIGWDSTNYTFMMDDERWNHLLQVNPGYNRFYNRSCLLFHLLEEVFMNQGATGDFSSGFVVSPANSGDELELENAARRSRGKGVVDIDSEDEEVAVHASRKGKEKVKKGKGKRKSWDMSTESFFAPSSPQFQKYIRVLDSIETHLSCKKSSGMTSSVFSPDKSKKPPVDDEDELKATLVDLCALHLDVNVCLKMADLLRNHEEHLIWFTCLNDDDRPAFVRHRGFFPPHSTSPYLSSGCGSLQPFFHDFKFQLLV
ncbi:uncharacterized protein [Coffea arabica]|uniref:Myb/SANT-like domain-containing protein n=1 Tax=Coffea arabica TaxID=13443 RepID=A0ABM4VTZ4_COFAR